MRWREIDMQLQDFSQVLRGHVFQLMAGEQLTQTTFAERLGRSQSSVSQLLAGTRRGRDLEVWRQIASYFGRSLAQLIGEAEQKYANSQKLQLRLPHDVGNNPAGRAPAVARGADRPTTRASDGARTSPAPTLPVTLHHRIETLAATLGRRRDQKKVQRLFEDIAAQILVLQTIPSGAVVEPPTVGNGGGNGDRGQSQLGADAARGSQTDTAAAAGHRGVDRAGARSRSRRSATDATQARAKKAPPARRRP